MDRVLRYLPKYKVILCSICRYCIKGDGIDLHLQRVHKDVHFKTRKEWRQQIKEDVDGQEVVEPAAVEIPIHASTPIQELPIMDGFQCLSCDFISGTVGTTQLHARTHGWLTGKQPSWKLQHVQVCDYDLTLTSRHSSQETLLNIFPLMSTYPLSTSSQISRLCSRLQNIRTETGI
jgi:hypothetical protein